MITRRDALKLAAGVLVVSMRLTRSECGFRVIEVQPEKSWREEPAVFELNGLPLPVMSSDFWFQRSVGGRV